MHPISGAPLPCAPLATSSFSCLSIVLHRHLLSLRNTFEPAHDQLLSTDQSGDYFDLTSEFLAGLNTLSCGPTIFDHVDGGGPLKVGDGRFGNQDPIFD